MWLRCHSLCNSIWDSSQLSQDEQNSSPDTFAAEGIARQGLKAFISVAYSVVTTPPSETAFNLEFAFIISVFHCTFFSSPLRIIKFVRYQHKRCMFKGYCRKVLQFVIHWELVAI